MKSLKLKAAASELALRSVESRKEKWGETEFNRRMKEWGQLGGRPKGTGTKSDLKKGK